MCPWAGSARVGTVDAGTMTICLELHLDGDLPTGRASDGSGGEKDFAGWLGLVAAVDALLSREGREAEHLREE
jgi:hypothetical protein